MKSSFITSYSGRWLMLAGALLLEVGFLAAPALRAQPAGPTPFPDTNNESAWQGTGPIRVFPFMNDNRAYFWTQRDKAQGAVVLVGDSLLGGIDPGKAPIAKAFSGVKQVANRAIGGDTTRGILFRLQEDVLDLHPSAVVLLGGTNDLSAKAPLEGIISNLTLILDAIQKASPTIPIILCNIPPREAPAAPVDPTQVADLNSRIATLAQGRPHVTLFDTYALFATPDGKPDSSLYSKDFIHPNDDGYVKLAGALAKVFEQLKIQ